MPAPLPTAALSEVLKPFGYSRLLPREAYTSAEVFAWEQEHFLRRQWVCVGRSEEVASPGDQKAVTVGAGSVLLVRAGDGTLRAFANACRHRGHELLPCGGTANARTVTCPYHAWSYDLSGTLMAAPNFRDAPDFRTAEFPLLGVPCEEWHGYVWVNSSGDAGPLVDQLGSVGDELAPWGIENLVTADRHEYVIEANWKALAENYNECYHCPTVHPELCQVSPPDSGADLEGPGAWVGGWMDLMPHAVTMSLDGSCGGEMIPGLTPHQLRTVTYFDIFPNLLVSVHPDYVMTHKLTPLAPDRTHIECTWAFAPESLRRPDFSPAYAVDFWDITNRQDWSACESVQRGLSAQAWTPGPIAPMESSMYRLETLFAKGYLGQELQPNSIGESVPA